MEHIVDLLKRYWLEYNSLKENLIISFIRWSWKWWQKRNKTSSTCQIIDKFDYLPYIPDVNKVKYKWIILFKVDIWRSQEDNLIKAINNWENKLNDLFTVQKERTKDKRKEKVRIDKIKAQNIERDMKEKYKNRFNT